MREPLETDGNTQGVPENAASGGIDWEAQPALLTTREAAALLGKSPGNIRARASKGDFGPTTAGPDGLPRYDRERVRAIGERMAARQAQTPFVSAPSPPSDSSIASLLAVLQAQQADQVALCQSWVDEAREASRLAKDEAKELRALLREREETTRETLTHMDMLYDQGLTQMQEILARERAHWERDSAAKDAEIERLKTQAAPEKGWAQLRRK